MTKEEVKEILVKHHGNDRFGTVFDAVCATIAEVTNMPASRKKKDEPKSDEGTPE